MTEKKITIVLLPGLNGTDGLFKPLIETVPENFAALCISYPTHEKKSYSELASCILTRLNEIQGNYILLGESFSGPLAILVSCQKPPGLLGTILVATFISAPNLKIARFLPWTLGFKLARPLYSLRIALSKPKNIPLLKAQLCELQKVSPEVMAFRVAEVFSVNVEKQLEECAVPLVYFRGKYDYIVPSWNLRKIQALHPGVDVVQFNTQHFLLQSAPTEAWAVISEFVNKIKEGI